MDISNENLENFRPASRERFYSIIYKGKDFLLDDLNQILIVQFGIEEDKIQYSNITDFWFHSFYSYCEDVNKNIDEFKNLVLRHSTAPLSQVEYIKKLLELRERLKEGNFPSVQGVYLMGFKMFDLPNFIAIIGETNEHYFAFYWETFQ